MLNIFNDREHLISKTVLIYCIIFFLIGFFKDI